MARLKKPLQSSLRSNITVAFFLAVVLLGVSITVTSHHVLHRALLDSTLPAESIQKIGRQVTHMLAGFTLASIVVAMGVAALLSRTITKPLRRLLTGVGEIGAGNLGAHLDIAGDDELGQLAGAFNDMAQKLKQSHDHLETTVEQRTAELTQTNQKLQTEIAERGRAEGELKESLSLLEATLEATADGIVVTDIQGKYKDFNSQFKELWHLPGDILETRDSDRILGMGVTRLRTPQPFQTEVLTLRGQPELQARGVLEFNDGAIVEYCSKPQCINDEIVGRVWSFRDITEKHYTQQKQERLLRQVADINEELSHFAYVVSHDLKAPLRGIKLLTEWLCADYGDQLGEEAKESLDLLQSRVGRMHNLIEGVLQYSRVGRIEKDKVEVDLNELLPSIIDAIAPPEHVTVTIEGALPHIECEPTRISQVFQNLLSNAVKYVDKPAGKIVVAHEDMGDAWRFSIADNGPGIEERYFDRIFKIFETLAPRDELESTGVGLTLVKKIVELYGGSIWVESEVGKGSTFFFTLPKQEALIPAEPVAVDITSCGGRLQETAADPQGR